MGRKARREIAVLTGSTVYVLEEVDGGEPFSRPINVSLSPESALAFLRVAGAVDLNARWTQATGAPWLEIDCRPMSAFRASGISQFRLTALRLSMAPVLSTDAEWDEAKMTRLMSGGA